MPGPARSASNRTPGRAPATYQLSQRADFFEVIASVDTMHRRPLINTRDEPHADPAHYRRLHLIIGDANMCEYATALKVGTASLVLDLLEAGALPRVCIGRSHRCAQGHFPRRVP